MDQGSSSSPAASVFVESPVEYHLPLLTYIYHHVFLPAKLPLRDDSDTQADKAIGILFVEALQEFIALVPEEAKAKLSSCLRTIEVMLDMRDENGMFLAERLDLAIRELKQQDAIAVHICAQNAGLIIRKRGETFTFESFELSPTVDKVMKEEGRLVRYFPGPAIEADSAWVTNPGFLRAFTRTIANLDVHTPQEAWPFVKHHKADTDFPEVRESVEPRFVTEMLTSVLHALGQRFIGYRIQKNTRDDILLKNTLKPWRRSPHWLFLRVVAQLCLFDGNSHDWYKSFMIYFMSKVVQTALEEEEHSEVLFTMQAKISRRILKLGLIHEPDWLLEVQKTIKRSEEYMKRIWVAIEKNEDSKFIRPTLDFRHVAKDRIQSLKYLSLYLEQTGVQDIDMLRSNIKISDDPRLMDPDKLPDPTILSCTRQGGVEMMLQDLESWVELYLSGWMERNISNDTCIRLAALIRFYVDKAGLIYKGNAEDYSIMFLTSIELWIALDKCACTQEPILRKYQPGFSETLLSPLLLRTKSQTLRVLNIEGYLQNRITKAKHTPDLVFDSDSSESLAVCYFMSSRHHQALYKQIEEDAQKERDRKCAELEERQKYYQNLLIDLGTLECDNESQWRKGKRIIRHNAGKCRKCSKTYEATNMDIDIHEWPIVQGHNKLSKARATIFELDVPQIIFSWREITYHLVMNVFADEDINTERPTTKPESQNIWTFSRYSGLQSYCTTPAGFLRFASFTLPFAEAHYKTQPLSAATKDSICVKNALNFRMFDFKSKTWVSERWTSYTNRGIRSIRNKCTFDLSGSFSSLEYAIKDTAHTSNEVIASQNHRPSDFSEHLYYAFGTLRSGHRLQWRNLARELAIPILDFSQEETYLLITQAIFQIGTPREEDELYRESHHDLADGNFCLSLLQTLDDRLGAVMKNWQEATSVKIFIEIVGKILTFVPEAENTTQIKDDCFRFLKRARYILMHWCQSLEERLLEEDTGEARDAELRMQILEISLICHASFGIDAGKPGSTFEDDTDLLQYYQCLVWIHEFCPAVLNGVLKRTVRRYRRINHYLEMFIRAELQSSSAPLDEVVSRVWTSYTPGVLWTVMERPNHCWVEAEVPSRTGNRPILMHFNFLSGALLIDGRPPSRLPETYLLRETYQHLLGKKILSVVPSTLPDMCYETRHNVHGLQLHFRLQPTENNLVIQAVRGDRKWQLIPHAALLEDFPSAFVHNYVHWCDLDTGVIEWRPLSERWIELPTNWVLIQRILTKGSVTLVDIRSPTAAYILSTFELLEEESHIYTTLDEVENKLDISLPRMNLHFQLSETNQTIQSKEFPEMIVDEDQSIGVFSGLVNKLVLCNPRTKARLVIIPHGDVKYGIAGHHVAVEIEKGGDTHIQFHIYEIDLLLGQLKDKGSLKTKLFKCLLHAVTSHHIPDSLTGRTGTEQALFILKEASTNSFYKICAEGIKVLEQISKLTPEHRFYPRYAKVMQDIDWRKLPSLSQHPHFWELTKEFYQSIKNQGVFHHTGARLVKHPNFGFNTPFLLKKQALRTSVFRTDGFGAESFTINCDLQYSSRECRKPARMALVMEITRLVDQWSTNLGPFHLSLSQLLESWGQTLKRDNPEITDISMLGYSPVWLQEPKDFLPENWLTLQSMLSRSRAGEHKYQLIFFLSTLIFSQRANTRVVYTLLAFATIPGLHNQELPQPAEYQLSDGYGPTRDILLEKLRPHCYKCNQLSGYDIQPLPAEEPDKFANRKKELLRAKIHSQLEDFVGKVMSQWPAERISLSVGEGYEECIKIHAALGCVNKLFCSWFRNCQLKQYLDGFNTVFQNIPTKSDEKIEPYELLKPRKIRKVYTTYLTLSGIFEEEAPCHSIFYDASTANWFRQWLPCKPSDEVNTSGLEKLCKQLRKHHPGKLERGYRDDLMSSLESLQSQTNSHVEPEKPLDSITQALERYREVCRAHLELILANIYTALAAATRTTNCIVHSSFLAPRVPIPSLLAVYTGRNTIPVSQQWIPVLHELALAITAVQRAERLLNQKDDTEFIAELENTGHEGWDPKKYPEWVVFEIENNILIRKQQAQIALEMIKPSSRKNSIMQLNMGGGKSSVVIPIVAAALADTKRLSRVVVLKPLFNQMFYLLMQRLGGILQRQIYFLPISRSTRVDQEIAKYIQDIIQKCRLSGGIFLIQPEHLLSFELMGLEYGMFEENKLGRILIDIQHELNAVSRDILDESDEIFAVDLELIYTIGSQKHVDFSPVRWAIIQDLLDIVWESVESVLIKFPQDLEINHWEDEQSIRTLRITHPEAGHALLEEVARHVSWNGVGGLSFQFYSTEVRNAIYRFISKFQNIQKDIDLLKDYALQAEHRRAGLLLLRGLLAGGILMFALSEKRYRVNYGLDLSRTMLAVPYRAKDQPTLRSEFSHPDTTIILTCLSYYAAGLSVDQLQLTFEKLVASDHPEDEYYRWIQSISTRPEVPPTLSGVNFKDTGVFQETLYPYFRINKKTIDYYLSSHVFPSSMRDFPHKISSSGWNIAKEKKQLTTGFSGTKDSRHVLPLSIAQQDIPEQSHVTALQLGCILRPQNQFHRLTTSAKPQTLDAEVLLEAVTNAKPPVRVIIDVGAQVLELENEQVAERWLSLTTNEDVHAVIYFNENNELWVYSRDGIKAPLYSSTYEQRMDQCLVYLDEVHTRGTDLKLPKDYRATVTLGPHLTKDRLAQACMRMRRLAEGQSIMFIAPPEIEQKILDVCKKTTDDTIDVCDVLEWSITETYAHIQRCLPRWAVQGLRYQRHEKIWSDIFNNGSAAGLRDAAKLFLEPEGLSIDQRYGIAVTNSEEEILQGGGDLSPYAGKKEQVNAIREKCQYYQLESSQVQATSVEEMQERELQPEKENEIQVESPKALNPAEYKLHKDVENFVLEGMSPSSSIAFLPAFEVFNDTSASGFLHGFSNDLLMTADFASTVVHTEQQGMDLYLRPVHWILSRELDDEGWVYVIISPSEANDLMPLVKNMEDAALHIYSPRITALSPSMEDLSFCAVSGARPPAPPSHIVMLINIFAGQTYLRSYEAYVDLCQFLGVCYKKPDPGACVQIASDGFIKPEDRKEYDREMYTNCKFTASPIEFLRKLIGIRRGGRSVQRSHLGKILGGILIQPSEFADDLGEMDID